MARNFALWIRNPGTIVAIPPLILFVLGFLGPLLIAISSSMGVDPIQFGAVIVTNVAIGMAAPPIGYCLFVGMAISGLKLGQISRAIWPQIVLMLLVLMLTTYIPQFSTFLVN